MLWDIHTHQQSPNSIVNFIVGKDALIPSGFFSAGIHPWYVSANNQQLLLQELNTLVLNPSCIAIGEAGLDKVCDTPLELQKAVFLTQMDLANKLHKPLIIHCVKAHQEIFDLKPLGKTPWILHGFNQKASIGEKALQKGFYLSLGKALLQDGSNASQMLRQMPLEQLFLETDTAEDTIEVVYAQASSLLGLSVEKLATTLQANFEAVFGVAK
jgi:TatD DNase family protein